MAQQIVTIRMPTAVAVPPGATSRRSPGAITPRAQPRHGLDAAGATLYAGTAVLPLSAITRYTAVGLSEKDLSSAFATIAIFSLVSAGMVFGVVETGWRTNFLLEGALFGAIAVCAVAELFSARRQTLFTFEIEARDGACATFVTADAREALAVKAALDHAISD